jgi:hypothetical protein
MYKIMDPHIAVFTELPVPDTKIESGDVSYTFHGYLDYALGFISADDTRTYPLLFCFSVFLLIWFRQLLLDEELSPSTRTKRSAVS